MEEMIKLWKEKGVAEAVFTFSCGGDSMNETEIALYDSKSNRIVDEELETYFDNEVYDEVEFYVNSDGHYIGEFGTVTITLEDDGEGNEVFEYSKYSEAEYSESETESLYIGLTNDQLSFIENHVHSIVGDTDDVTFNYKNDFILKDNSILEDLELKIISSCKDYEFLTMQDGEEDDWFEFRTFDDLSDNELTIENGELKIQITKFFTVTR